MAVLRRFGGIEAMLDRRLCGRHPSKWFARAGDVVTLPRRPGKLPGLAFVAMDGRSLLTMDEAHGLHRLELDAAETAWVCG